MRFELNGAPVDVADDSGSLLEVLRDRLGETSVKDGCSPQGQCGCCTVLVDGEPRVSCVTPARRVSGRAVTTLDGLDPEALDAWSTALCATGGSQCGFCTPGIVVRLESARARGTDLTDRLALDRALAAHLCRCTGWQTILEAAAGLGTFDLEGRDLDAAGRRAGIEGHAPQRVGPDIALGHGGFADDSAPIGTEVGLRNTAGEWVIAATMTEARAAIGKVQGRRTTVESGAPIAVPDGDWALQLATVWVEPAYLETDASWAAPGAEPSDPLANGGAFGGKVATPVPAAAAALAEDRDAPVRLRWSREDVVRFGPKRPPMAICVRADGSGVVRVARTEGIADRIRSVAPDWDIEEVDVVGPPTSAAIRAAGWGEVLAVRAAANAADDGTCEVTTPDGAWASARVIGAGVADGADASDHDARPRIEIAVRCGDVLDRVVLRSYCIGAAHMALGWATSEAIAVDDDGECLSLTVRSLGIVRPGSMPAIDVRIEDDPDGEPVSGSDAVFVAVAAAVWRYQGCPPEWPSGVPFLDSPA